MKTSIMEPREDEIKESYGLGWVELLVLTLRDPFVYPSQEMKPKSQSDHNGIKKEAMPLHMHNSKDLLNLIIFLVKC